MHESLKESLNGISEDIPLKEAAGALFNALGYRSSRTVDVEGIEGFMEMLDDYESLKNPERERLSSWRSADIIFQVTGDEISEEIENQTKSFPELLQGFDRQRIKSFLFVAADLENRSFGRTELAEMVRTVNRRFSMPVIILFRHGASLTLAAVHRRPHKRDDGRDVLERVTLVKDIRAAAPHGAHLRILSDLALPGLIKGGVNNFDRLHAEWERVLDIEVLNRNFYGELYDWFERAVKEAKFPDDGSGKGSTERQAIRLITRLLFVWFMKEKDLAPEDLFEESFAAKTLKNYHRNGSDYYRAVLQNLFFATLNTEIDKRGFGRKDRRDNRNFSEFCYRKLLTDPAGFVKKLKKIPFVNGGLFDCLDDSDAIQSSSRRIDAFTDDIENQGQQLDVPAHLFFGDKGLFPLFRRYKFTVEEHTPLDQEVALDPELLGRVFENLLATYNPETRESARRQTGSYYTPRHVVDYMVGEALAAALAERAQPSDEDGGFWRERLGYLLDYEDAFDDAAELFRKEEIESLVEVIADLRILDPAAGSGAFPMGVLHRLTLALRRLDPDNRHWESFQKKRAGRRSSEAFDETDGKDARNQELLDISRTFDVYRDSDFGRKLYLIQNCIYGVDIQPIACQIAKLRFFISLAIEQTTNEDSGQNYGIRPLPNLETRFVAADTLMDLSMESQLALGDDKHVRRMEGRLRNVRERHFNARTRAEKIELRKEDKNLRTELASELESCGLKPNKAQAVSGWDPYDQNARAGWFDPEWMFGVTEGFDVVIGNPPYIQLQKDVGALAKKYQGVGYETFVRKGDIYQLFYERGCNLLKSGSGTLAYITSNSWLRAEYGKPLRRWFAEHHTPLRLIDMGKDVFDAIVDSTILLVRKGGKVDRMPAVDLDYPKGEAFPPPENQWGETRLDGENVWRILSDIEWRILDKMYVNGTPLRDWDVQLNYGIKTGYNTAFIIDDMERDALIDGDPSSTKIIKPVLRGRDIKRWRAQREGKWLVDTHNGYNDDSGYIPPIDVADYPGVKRHLDRFFPELEARKNKGRTTYNLGSCAYRSAFSGEKLFWMEMSPKGRFSYSNTEEYCNNKGYIITGKSLKYLCSVLNSTLLTWFAERTAVTTGAGLIQWNKFLVERLPIPKPTAAEQRPFVRLVDRILDKKDADPHGDVSDLEAKIDRLVYELYGLTQKEVETVKNTVRI